MWPILLLSLLTALTFILKNNIIKHNTKLPPGPPRLPIIGNLHQLGPLPHRSLRDLSKTYGSVMFLKLGGKPAIVVSSSEAAEEVLKTHDLECCGRPSLAGTRRLSYNSLDLAFSPYGKHWRDVRKVCVVKLFSQKRVQSFRFVREEEISDLIDSLCRSSSSSCPVDLWQRMHGITGSIILRTAFGKRFGGSGLDNERFPEMIHGAESLLGSFAACDIFPYFGWIVDKFTGFQSRLERSFRELDDFYECVIQEHANKSTLQEHEDIVDLLLQIEKDQSDDELGHPVSFTRDCTKSIIMDVFLAGVATGAVTLTWAMAELAKNPRVMKKVQAEIRSFFKHGNFFPESDLHKLQYLKMVLKEVLRLHPAAPLLIPRETTTRFDLFDYEVHPKTLVQVNVWAIGRDPKYWDNPEEFYPERFSESSIDYKGQHFEFLPFGAGRRVCPGIHMGMAIVELTLANMLCFFDWKLPNGMEEKDIDLEEAPGLAIYMKSALKLVPIIHGLLNE